MIIFQVINNIAINSIGGGAELFAIRLLKQLQLNNNCHLIIVWRYNTDYEDTIIDSLKQKGNIHFLTDSNKRGVRNYYYVIKNLNKLIAIYSPQIINSHSALPDILNSLMKLFKGKVVKVIRTIHTDKHWFRDRFFELIFAEFLFPVIFDLEIAISKRTQERLDKRLVAQLLNKKSIIINNGISRNILKKVNQTRSKEDKKNSKNNLYKIITIGRLSIQKGYEHLLKAIPLINETYKLRLYIFGEGSEKRTLKQIAKDLNITKRVCFMGYQNDVLDFMLGCDVFVSSSLWEGFPTVILEAMALRIPIIATDVSGSRELIKNQFSGILVKPERPKELAEAITKMMNSPEQANMYAKNAFISIEEFTIENVAIKYQNVYNGVLDFKVKLIHDKYNK